VAFPPNEFGNNNYASIVMYEFIQTYNFITYECLNIQYKLILSKCNIIAISGDSGSGKTTLMKHLKGLFFESNVINLETDRYHKWERGNENYQTITHLNPDANYLELMSDDVYNLKIGNDIYQVDYDHTTGKFTNKQLIESKDNIILCGLHTLYNQKMNDIIDIKVFMDTDRELIKKWKIERDVNERGYSLERVIQQMESRDSDYYKYIDSQKENADIVIQFYEDTLQLHHSVLKMPNGNVTFDSFVAHESALQMRKGVKCRVFIKNTKIIHKIVCELLDYDIHYMENGNIFFELHGLEYFKEIVTVFNIIIHYRLFH
jgi:uridine kinase